MSIGTCGRPPAERADATPDWDALAALDFEHLDAQQVLDKADDAVAALTPCAVEASYLRVDGVLVARRPAQPGLALEPQLLASGVDVPVSLPSRRWARAYALRSAATVLGYLVVSAPAEPSRDHQTLLSLLVQKAGAALAVVAARTHASADLIRTNKELQEEIRHLRARTNTARELSATVAAGRGEQGVADVIHELTGLAVCVEDRFGYLRAWAGAEQPPPHPKPDPVRREQALHTLAGRSSAVRMKDRVSIAMQSRGEILGVLSLVDPHRQAGDDHISALEYGGTILALELSHQRNLAKMELSVRRELLDDLLAGTEPAAAYARAAALGHDLRPPHYVVAIQHPHADISALNMAACQAASAQHLNFLHGQHQSMVVLLVDGRPNASALHQAISKRLGDAAAAIGIGCVCRTPADFPDSFAKACRALNIRLHSATPDGATAFDELGFYRVLDAAHSAGSVEDYLHEWLGILMQYDENKNADLVQTLSEYLECGGNYDEAANALHIHRSTLRYRLARIRELTGYDLRDVDTRFNLHAAVRAWRFLNPTG